jgi:hypothetical protein
MTELSFLLDLLLNHKLQKATKDILVARIGLVEESMKISPQPQAQRTVQPTQPSSAIVPTQIAQTQETAKAISDLQALRHQAMSGVPEPGRTGPRKIGRQ